MKRLGTPSPAALAALRERYTRHEDEDDVARAKRRLMEYARQPAAPAIIQQHPLLIAGACAVAIALLSRSGTSRTAMRMAGFLALRTAAKEFARSIGQRI